MTAYAMVKAALDGLGYDVRKYPGKPKDRTYIALSSQGVDAGLWAGNRPLRNVCTLQVDLYTRENNLDSLTEAVVAALTAHGILTVRIGAEVYAEDTATRYLPILCEVPVIY